MARISKGIQLALSWVAESNGNVPEYAVDAGNNTFICRAWLSGDLIPGKVVPRLSKAYVSFNGKEHEVKRYDVLVSTPLPDSTPCYEWEKASKGHVHKYTVVGGRAKDGSPLYIARAQVLGETVVGKVHEGHKCAYFPHGCKEHQLQDYEILVYIK